MVNKMLHIFKKGKSDKTLLLLHGTGGDEYDLIDIGYYIDENANILSLRGNVVESGMNRFFKRYAPGKYDLESINDETVNLDKFIDEAVNEYNLDKSQITGLGYSNGANLLQSLAQQKGSVLNRWILFNPSYIKPNFLFQNLSGSKMFITTSKIDPFTTYEEQLSLQKALKEANADLTVFWSDHGHQLTQESIQKAKIWFDDIH